MILDRLTLDNVGTFAGRHVIDLAPKTRTKPIVLIGGLNGAGKTTILEAIQLGFYGALVHSTGRRSGSYDKYLRGLIHRGVPLSEGGSIELTFTAYQEGQEHQYWLRRSWKAGGSSIREILLVSVDGRHDRALTTNWNEHVETFLPRGVAGLFFFDGEQIEALADMDRSRQVLRSALDALLGLDLVDRLSSDLSVLRKRNQSDQLPEDIRHAVAEKQQVVTALRQSEEACLASVAALRIELEVKQKQVLDATEAFRAVGGELLEQRVSAEAAANAAKASLAQCEEGVRDELSDLAPLLLVQPLLTQLQESAEADAEQRRNRLLANALEPRDSMVIDKLRRSEVQPSIVETVSDLLARDRSRLSAASGSPIQGLVSPSVVEGIVRSHLPSAHRRLKAVIERRSALREELDQSERALEAIPDPEAVAVYRLARDDAQVAVHRAEASLNQAEEQLRLARNERARADAAYESALDKAAHANLQADDTRRLVEHAERAQVTLSRLRTVATQRHLTKISQLVLEALATLLRKDRLVGAVDIDPETYDVRLTSPDGSPLPANDLSAGERQLLAVALLWGLARASGQPLPVVIDTPLGRLDGTHRQHLLDRYFPHASHQVILLSTDTEIDADAYARIASRVGRAYRLEFHSDTNSTTIENGYF
ncbi:DNA sulfur modification protein DndD [Gordonia sputi]|uniref:Nuclease SbcCD subunit C n=1 Tax=Gordonia sputi NBRC 100414 TaxID=1089453 RepID=H5U2Y2_9ACTN|nr:DNA sulfur modification protein DndD [Gordonia sputi]NKY95895.1 DNA sulfur modification protein DndD [Gordonia sputi]GAB40090.1 hypothetical protein GOSPT_088_00040 [Gordonia sputi NBRC 100414]